VEFRKKYFADERADDLKEIGQPRQRADVRGHVTGSTTFYGDHSIDGLLHLKMVRSPHHHARIHSIDVSAAEKHPGVKRVVLARDVPHNIYTILAFIGILPEDEPVLAFDKVRWQGEPIAAVLADSARAAYEAVAKVKVEYEPLDAIFDVEEALKPGAPLVNEYHPQNHYHYDSGASRRIRLGDVERGFREADFVLEQRYQSSPIEQAPIETTGCLVTPDQNGRFTCYTSTQAMFFSLTNSAIILEVPESKLHFVGGTVGGGFGGKTDTVCEPIAILASMLTRRPVYFSFTRDEEMQSSSPRAAERIYIKDGLMKDGRIVAREVRCYVDAGAYSRHSPYGTNKAAAHFPGPYTIPNVAIDAYCVYTNRTPSSAMRGFGCTIGDFALEVQMDKLARLIGMDPLEIRFINAYRDGDMKAHHQPTTGAALIECMQEAANLTQWPIASRYRALDSRRPRGSE
jgi:CO/xanthine dehydrogenase Mo-binding subunit